MKTYNPTISLARNSRGCYIIDTVKGCRACGVKAGGCYGDCYALKIANRYKLEFDTPVIRDFYVDAKQLMLFDFKDERHMWKVINEVWSVDMPFVRIGEMGDPSEDWEHTISICEKLQPSLKPIVIITKHWHAIPDTILDRVAALGLYINTSISALDDEREIEHRWNEYNRLRNYCHSVLRIVSCNFNLDNEEGERMNMIQDQLVDNDRVIDTVFRPSASNPLVSSGVINVEKIKFLGATMLASLRDKGAYVGRCDTCPDMCGVA